MKHGRIGAAFLLAFLASRAAFCQDPVSKSASRGIVPEQVLQARPAAKSPVSAAPRPGYRPVTTAGTSNPNFARPAADSRQVGVTIWKLRHALPADSGSRILVQETDKTVEWIPERVASASRLHEGDLVRVSIESPEAGFLYVIDRERYASGERGDPWLIFPTSHTHGGDNRVFAGKLIDIPAQDDQPNFFTLHAGGKNESEEELTVLFTAQPLEGMEIPSRAQRLTEVQVAQWDRPGNSRDVQLFELAGGAGRTWTVAEQQAAQGGTRLLTQTDPPPQTVYRVVAKPGSPLVVKVRLRYSPTAK